MKNYRLFIVAIIAIGVIFIGTSNPAKNLYKSTNFISKNNITEKETKKDDDNKRVKNNSEYTICIDPGHQEKGDPNLEPVAPGSNSKKARVSSGATGIATKKPEYKLNLEASIVLKHILENKGYNVVMTRERHDINISNAERAILANDKNADMVIRVHADSLDNSGKTGASILIPQKDGQYTSKIFEDSNKCALKIKDALEKENIQVNGIFERNDLTGFNWSKVPVVLIEMGFMSNYNEDLMMSNPEYQRKMMQSVADGLETYLKDTENRN
ncbi:N-acetylmuramoyl-L-alanine amidase [Paraclostridium bifermentans]|uniref:N-acetylmuramoyl-L-alanine amidase n=1 Tax=Paraclostridium TaxID=1849822 RepID=UPI001243196F|nr:MULTISPECIES: N-acetylmuramoyl-L-alanine amidase [Paraclostridium]MBZ6005872.1 N-acetylmuramoyl-L-alanine amidase [Paraclostridium bifermentans]MDU0295555.1 N-acetylmuramoyl-L-alanine amidase [Paraclostridium sp. MRS3W1]